MDVKSRIAKLQKSRKRRLTINDSSELSEVQLPETNVEEESHCEENFETNYLKFEQGVTNKGNLALWHEGYRYTIHINGWWRCTNRDCPAKAKVEQKDSQFIGTLGKLEHNHPPAIQKKRVEEIRNTLKSGLMPVLTEIRSNIPDEVYISLGSDQALQRLLQRQKNKHYGNVNCTDMSKMVIPESLTQKYGSSTLIYDSRTKRGYEDVVLVFSHLRLLDILSENKQWAIDGTFSAAPKPFVQCLCIGAFVHSRIVICVQALLPSKRAIHYGEVLEVIKRAISPNAPKRGSPGVVYFDWQLLNVLTLLGLQMSGYIDGLRSTERQPEERDTEDGVDNENSENDAPTTSSSMFI
uniref:FLYWCH-type domain-containing protein n=1 Tax=Meloidogyne hapla TaxID=6305 RepID=A0A1I8BRM8_MELHA